MDPNRELLRQATETNKAKVAVDVVRTVNPTDGRDERHLYTLAVEYLTGYFGGVVEPTDDDQ